MWAIPTGTSSALKKKKSGKESQYMVSRPELGSDPPIGSDRESGCDTRPPNDEIRLSGKTTVEQLFGLETVACTKGL